MITKMISDFIDVAEIGYKSVGGASALARYKKQIDKLELLADIRDIPAVELGMAIYYYETETPLAYLPSNVAYLVGALEMIEGSSPRGRNQAQ